MVLTPVPQRWPRWRGVDEAAGAVDGDLGVLGEVVSRTAPVRCGGRVAKAASAAGRMSARQAVMSASAVRTPFQPH